MNTIKTTTKQRPRDSAHKKQSRSGIKYHFFILIMAVTLFLQCGKENEENPQADCEIISSSLQVDGNAWEPCGGDFTVGTLQGVGPFLNFITNDAKFSTGEPFTLIGSLFAYTGTGTYEPNQTDVLLVWSKLVDLQITKTYTSKSGTFEIVQQDDKLLKAKIDCIFSDDSIDLSIKGEFELKPD